MISNYYHGLLEHEEKVSHSVHIVTIILHLGNSDHMNVFNFKKNIYKKILIIKKNYKF